MSSIITGLALLLAISISDQSGTVNECPVEEPPHKIRSITTRYFDSRQPDYPKLEEYRTFNEQGQPLEIGKLSAQGERKPSIHYFYNEYGHLVQSDGDYLNSRFEYRYDEHHNWTEKTIITASKRREIFVREITYAESPSSSHAIDWSVLLDEDLQGGVEKIAQYRVFLVDAETQFTKEMASRSVYRFAANSSMLVHEHFNKEGQILQRRNYHFEENFKTQADWNPAGEDQAHHSTRYNENGDKLEHHMSYQGRVKSEEYYTYDENGDLLKKEVLKSDKSGEYLTYSYEYLAYDEKGNWTNRKEWIDDWLNQTVMREIEYDE